MFWQWRTKARPFSVNFTPPVSRSNSSNPTSAAVADAIINLKIVYPMILLVITVILVKVYPITPTFAKEMRTELKARRAQAKAAQ